MRTSDRGILAAICAALFSCLCLAQNPRQDPAKPSVRTPALETPVPSHEMTAMDVEAFLDGFMPLQLGREDIAGAVIAIVKDGKVLFAKGYGYSDVASKAPVSPGNTLFRPGSISKLFTWTSVMQLVEQGKLDLDQDVNSYIDFKIPEAFGRPITLRNIMTHSAGFEETAKELFVPAANDLKPIKEYLPAHLPQRIFPSGTTPAYSNYATTLAGYIVERTSGKPFNDYVSEFIFKPLKMTHCTFVQPLPDALRPLMSSGYALASAGAKPYEFVEAAPAGSSAVSALDMTHFMLAHLHDGEYESGRILRPETARLMHSRQLGLNDSMNGMALGFYEESRNGHRIIGHGGDTVYFHSDLHLIADANTGFFVSYNSGGKGQVDSRGELWHKFLDRYFPYAPPSGTAPATASEDAKAVSGSYKSSRRSETTILKIGTLLGEFPISADKDGTITIGAFRSINGLPKHWREIGPMTFRDVDGQDRVAFQRDAEGRMIMLSEYPFFVFQRVSAFENRIVNFFVIGFSLGVLLLTVLLWPVAALVRSHYGLKNLTDPSLRRWSIAVRFLAICALVSVLVLAIITTNLSKPGALNASLDPAFRLMQLFVLIGVAGTLAAIYYAMRTWKARAWWWTKLLSLAIALAFIGFSWFVLSWNILHPSLRY
jgi:CubicO group peptidase (beta-lactamase class C family)